MCSLYIMPRFLKGSEEAKAYMASIRSKKAKSLEHATGEDIIEGGKLRPFFCRQGNKYPIVDLILEHIPDDHKIYVEPFMGSAAVFFNKPLAEKNVINDLDKDTVQRMRMIKKAPMDLTKYRDDLNTLEKTKYFFDNHTTSEADLLTLEKIKTCNGFNGVYANTSKQVYKVNNPYSTIKNIDEYKSKLNRATIENKDYEKIIKKYDSKDTFFFIDPPYENTDTSFNYAEDTEFDLGRLVEVLKGIKGKFLMTLNDSQNIRQLFKHFYIKPFKVLNAWFNREGKGEKYRREVFIANYPL